MPTLRSLLSPIAWKERAIESAWAINPRGTTDPVTRTWPFDPALLKDVTINWPDPSSYRFAPRRMLGDQILAALRQYHRVREMPIDQPYDGVVNFEFWRAGRRFRVILETSDYAELNEKAYADADLHFKMEFALTGYGTRDRLLPGGYVNAGPEIYHYLPRLRQIRDQAAPRYEVHGRFGLSMEKRRRPIELLRAAKGFAFFGGEGKVRYRRFLEEVALSKVCIDLPSMSSVTFRMIDYLAIGCAVVGPPHTNRMIEPFQEGVHVTYCRPAYEDLEEVVVSLLRDEDRRRSLIANTRAFFDAVLHRRQLGSYYLHMCLKHLA